MKRKTVAVVDYGSGNLRSVSQAVQHVARTADVEVLVTSRAQDVLDLAELLKAWPDREFNVEGNPFHNLMDSVRDLRERGLPVHQVTFVPDSEGQFTSDHGWSFPADAARLQPLIDEAHALNLRVSLFMDADPAAMATAKAVGADRIELYTEPFAAAWSTTPIASDTATVVTETDADFCPLGTVTDAGSVAAAASDESCTAYPPLGAGFAGSGDGRPCHAVLLDSLCRLLDGAAHGAVADRSAPYRSAYPDR